MKHDIYKDPFMPYSLEVRAFFFNAKTDYLPYYKNFTVILKETDTTKSLLSEVRAQNENFAYPEEKLLFKLNELVCTGEETIEEVVEKLGTSLLLEPVVSYRSNHCLMINDDDFSTSFELLSPYASEEDKVYYDSLYAVHYASETFKFSHDYIGDAVLALAYKMISEGSEYEEEILEAVSDEYDGLAACEYENNLFSGEGVGTAIKALHDMVTYPKSSRVFENITRKFSEKALKTFDADSIEGKHIACYAGQSTLEAIVHQKIDEKGGKVLHFPRAKRLCGRTLLGKQDNLAYLKAATTLLDALDAGAELLVIVNNQDYAFFRENFSSIQKRIGREIPLPLMRYDHFVTFGDKIPEETVSI